MASWQLAVGAIKLEGAGSAPSAEAPGITDIGEGWQWGQQRQLVLDTPTKKSCQGAQRDAMELDTQSLAKAWRGGYESACQKIGWDERR